MHAPPLLFLPLKPSRQLAAAILAIHLSAVAGIGLAGLPIWLVLAAWAVLGISAWTLLRRHALLAHPLSLIRLQSRADGSLECLTRDGEWLAFSLRPQSTLFPLFAVLSLKPPGGGRPRAVTIFPDALSGDDWRTLRVWLRWQAGRTCDSVLGSGKGFGT